MWRRFNLRRSNLRHASIGCADDPQDRCPPRLQLFHAAFCELQYEVGASCIGALLVPSTSGRGRELRAPHQMVLPEKLLDMDLGFG